MSGYREFTVRLKCKFMTESNFTPHNNGVSEFSESFTGSKRPPFASLLRIRIGCLSVILIRFVQVNGISDITHILINKPKAFNILQQF